MANTDTLRLPCYAEGYVDLIANDTDDDDDLPLVLRSVQHIAGSAVESGGDDAGVVIRADAAGPSSFSYIVANRRGATATGRLNVQAFTPTTGCGSPKVVPIAKGAAGTARAGRGAVGVADRAGGERAGSNETVAAAFAASIGKQDPAGRTIIPNPDASDAPR